MPFETFLGRLKVKVTGVRSNKGQNGHMHVLSLSGP